jgi:hypothetical protein
MPDSVAQMLDRLPDKWIPIEATILRDPRFLSLCEDHGEAVEALRRWAASPSLDGPERVVKCRQLVAELEQEILSELTKQHG